jgi:hypothetical protein
VRVEAGAEGLAQAEGQFAGIAEADEGHQVLVERKFSVHLAQQHGHCHRVHGHVAAPCGCGTACRGRGSPRVGGTVLVAHTNNGFLIANVTVAVRYGDNYLVSVEGDGFVCVLRVRGEGSGGPRWV